MYVQEGAVLADGQHQHAWKARSSVYFSGAVECSPEKDKGGSAH